MERTVKTVFQPWTVKSKHSIESPSIAKSSTESRGSNYSKTEITAAMLSNNNMALSNSQPLPGSTISPLQSLNKQNLAQARSSKLYCATCKKRFSNEATFLSHNISDKHRKNVQMLDAQKNKPPKPQATRSSHNESLSFAERNNGIAIEVTGNLNKARRIMDKDPATAGVVLWNIANDVARYNDGSMVQLALESVLQCISKMEIDKGLRSSPNSSTSWNARSLLKVALECRLALARLELLSNRNDALVLYERALYKFLGIDESAVDTIYIHHDPLRMHVAAITVSRSIPRKFQKPEDINQAIAAMEEVSSVIIEGSDDYRSVWKWRGLALCFILHSFSLDKCLIDTAYNSIKRIISYYSKIGLPHFGDECSNVLISTHLSQDGSHYIIARSIALSIERGDLFRAHEIACALSSIENSTWSRYLINLILGLRDADVDWLSTKCLNELEQLKGVINNQIYNTIHDCVIRSLEPYTLYMPPIVD